MYILVYVRNCYCVIFSGKYCSVHNCLISIGELPVLMQWYLVTYVLHCFLLSRNDCIMNNRCLTYVHAHKIKYALNGRGAILVWVHTCNVTAYRNTVSWKCGRDSWPRNVSKVGYALTLRACSVCCRYLAVASKGWYGYGLSRFGRATWHVTEVRSFLFFFKA